MNTNVSPQTEYKAVERHNLLPTFLIYYLEQQKQQQQKNPLFGSKTALSLSLCVCVCVSVCFLLFSIVFLDGWDVFLGGGRGEDYELTPARFEFNER